ncbi:hypothetical protein EI94DRAFT_502598 [Lactarius quietus]|nr:hypothetical protein EI94DRAFT_502598 [Lactarius quietus]
MAMCPKMSAPLPPAGNPDRRPLPDGWITRYDENYSAWYYVDTRAQPPRSSWQHPNGPLSSPQQSTNYSPPPNPPPNRAYNGSNPSYPGQYGSPQTYNQTSPYSSGYQGGQPDQRNFPSPQGGYPGSQYPSQGWTQGGGWQQSQQPPSQVYTQPQSQPTRHGLGRGAGGAGLVGGLVLGEMFEHHEERERDEAFDQGYIDGQDNDFGGGGGW